MLNIVFYNLNYCNIWSNNNESQILKLLLYYYLYMGTYFLYTSFTSNKINWFHILTNIQGVFMFVQAFQITSETDV